MQIVFYEVTPGRLRSVSLKNPDQTKVAEYWLKRSDQSISAKNAKNENWVRRRVQLSIVCHHVCLSVLRDIYAC